MDYTSSPHSVLLLIAGATFILLYIRGLFRTTSTSSLNPSEDTYITILPDGTRSERRNLPSWLDASTPGSGDEDVYLSIVVPAYNEENRLWNMLEEAVHYLQGMSDSAPINQSWNKTPKTAELKNHTSGANDNHRSSSAGKRPSRRGWEVLVVSDGSSDRTVDVALKFAHVHQLGRCSRKTNGPMNNSKEKKGASELSGEIRVVELVRNRGKGGAVTHGMRHARGRYIAFADADGASRFCDLQKLLDACHIAEDESGRGIAIGSRAHLLKNEATVERSKLRSFLMILFHLFLRLLAPAATARLKDTQCGFKLFSRPCLPYILPYMHSQGWIFDVEMLMLADKSNIFVVEVPIGWKEVGGSKINILKDSVGMALDLIALRLRSALGIYRA